MNTSKKPVKTKQLLYNATTMYHILLHKEDGKVVKREYQKRQDVEENLRKIYGLDW